MSLLSSPTFLDQLYIVKLLFVTGLSFSILSINFCILIQGVLLVLSMLFRHLFFLFIYLFSFIRISRDTLGPSHKTISIFETVCASLHYVLGIIDYFCSSVWIIGLQVELYRILYRVYSLFTGIFYIQPLNKLYITLLCMQTLPTRDF